MSKLRSLCIILQDHVDPDDKLWSYDVPNLPHPQQTNAAGLIKFISAVSSESKQSIQLRFDKPPDNRVTRGEDLDRLLLISFADFRLQWPPSSPEASPRRATVRETGDYITRLLVTGIFINGAAYYFFGHSNSQLKSRSCFMFAASKAEISTKVDAMGDLSKLKSVGKKAKRIGLLFSSAEMALMLSPDRCEDIDDIKIGDYMFTDGCGLISRQLASQLVQRRNIVYRSKRYLPSVFQIRYRGYKGVLTLDPSLPPQVQAQFRDSMRKFKDAPDLSFSVVAYSKPYAFGYLNDEVVILLHSLGISEEVLLRKQADHLRFLQSAGQGDPRAAYQFLAYCDRLPLAEKLLLDGIETVGPTLQGLVRAEFTKMLNKRDEQRCRILIPRSRLLFGVCDPGAYEAGSSHRHPGKLRDGECFVRVTNDYDGEARTIINTEVLVTRNPCLHPGDLQKFKAVDIPEYSHLVDCIVFPTRGKRPSADLMSGGDLDGDKFFVTWDPDIIPAKVSEAAEYPGVKEPPTFSKITDDDRAEYFARYANASLGRVKNLYLKWVRLGNAMSPECQQLNRLFSQCVDGNRIKIPQGLEDPPECQDSVAPFILDVLHEASTQLIQSIVVGPHQLTDVDDLDVMDLLLSRDKIVMSEFELLQLTLKWCNKHSVDIAEFTHLFNFSALSDEEQIWFLGRLPPLKHLPSLVRNGLVQSNLINVQELKKFNLDHPCTHWRPVFTSVDRMGRFISTMCRTLETFHKKLIILKVDERLTLAIYVPHKIQRASEVQVDSNVRVFAFPRSQGSSSPNYRVMPTKKNYRLYCDEHNLQLYESKRVNTWIFLTKSQMNETNFRNEKNSGIRRRMKEQTVQEGVNYDCRISVALQKISGDIQRHVGRLNRAAVLDAEIYVISNRDVKSMLILDEWLNAVDTEEVLPLFERLEMDYKIPTLTTVQWDTYSEVISTVARDRNLSSIRLVKSVDELYSIMDIVNNHGEKTFLRDIYLQILSLEASDKFAMRRESIALSLLDFLPTAIYLLPTFLQSQTWKSHKDTLEERLIRLAPSLLSKLALATNELQGFIRQPLMLLLRELKLISFHNFAALVELISLSVRSSEAALDLLVEILEPETSRLLVGRPLLVQQFVRCLYGIALDHIDEASNSKKPEKEAVRLVHSGDEDGYAMVTATLRIDYSMSSLRKDDHIRLVATSPPQNAPAKKPYSMDARVRTVEQGTATFLCYHPPPSYVAECAWHITNCGSFVTSKTMIDAVKAFYIERESCCKIFALLAGISDINQIDLPRVELPFSHDPELNDSQNKAVEAALTHSLTFIWGPPGTGKTQTIVSILVQMVNALPEARFLITAPTHNAVDNMLKRFISKGGIEKTGVRPVRVSTQFSKVSPELRDFTCDAMFGKEVSANFPARRQAEKRIKQSRLIFSTCSGSGLGLLRSELFSVVLIDEASQQTEPQTLIPLTKSCSRAILVGDHVQLRATVQKHAILTNFDISLFERHYASLPPRPGVAKVMLDTQYRMHRSICEFSSAEFYAGKLRTAVRDCEREIQGSRFPWPGGGERMVFVECGGQEDVGRVSKGNKGQVEVCRRVVELLGSPLVSRPKNENVKSTIAVLTGYNRQKEALASALPGLEVSSVDGFQGREADIVIYVTVRSNLLGDLGFLADMRRLNVVMTRARAGVIVIGNRATLTGKVEGDGGEAKEVWGRLVGRCVVLGDLSEVQKGG